MFLIPRREHLGEAVQAARFLFSTRGALAVLQFTMSPTMSTLCQQT